MLTTDYFSFDCGLYFSIFLKKHMSSNVGLFPGYCEWFTKEEKLVKYNLWVKSGLLGLWTQNILKIILNGYISNGYLSAYIISSVLFLGLWRKSLTPDSGFCSVLLKRADFCFLKQISLTKFKLPAVFSEVGSSWNLHVSTLSVCRSGVN